MQKSIHAADVQLEDVVCPKCGSFERDIVFNQKDSANNCCGLETSS